MPSTLSLVEGVFFMTKHIQTNEKFGFYVNSNQNVLFELIIVCSKHISSPRR